MGVTFPVSILYKYCLSLPKEAANCVYETFFSKGKATAEQIALIKKKEYAEFNPAHIKEAFIRSAIHDRSLEDVFKEMRGEIELYKKAFSKPKTNGFGLSARDLDDW